jgi:pimeloyl-ACP methyl ester carboxylesterase
MYFPYDPLHIRVKLASTPEKTMPSDELDHNKSYLRGTSQLAVDAIVGVVDLVESMHRTVSTFGGLFAGGQLERTTGFTGFVYSNIRAVAALVGSGLDAALAARVDEVESPEGREAVVAALNGVFGDFLVTTNNPLAITMQLRQDGEPASADDPALHEAIRASGGRVLLMVHGSSSNDLQWYRKGHNHGAALADELDYVPIYVLYNSGRHISENGVDLADLLESFVAELPELQELSILAHSMGGLVARSACYYAEEAGYQWRKRLKKLVFLSTPHHGALLERSGNWVDNILQISPYSAPFARLGKIRSAGVTDLRYGNCLHRDWQEYERFAYGPDKRCPLPLPEGVECYTLAATIGEKGGRLTDHVVGDGMVQLDSALGRHEQPEFELAFPESHQLIVRNTGHLDVLCAPEVFEAVKGWLAGGTPSQPVEMT